MELVATYPNLEHAAPAIAKLKESAIPHEVRTGEENGLEIIEIHVAPAQFDPACDLIEKAEEEIREAAMKKSRMRCTKCGSPELQRRPDIDCSTSMGGITGMLECKKCGQLIPQSR